MDSEIIYEFERNHVYGNLSRAMEGLRQNSHGLLAEARAQVATPFKNDALFYSQVIIAHNCLSALQEFCDARCHGVEYYEARRTLMDVFEPFMDKPFSDENYALYPPSYRDPMPGTNDAEKEKAYRYRHLDEFSTTVHVLEAFLRKGNAYSWSSDAVFNQIHSRLNSFMDPAVAARGFDKFPVPHEIQYFVQAAKWLQERAAQSLVKTNLNFSIDTTGMPGMFGRVAGNSLEDKIKYGHYNQSCENLGVSLIEVISSGEYLKMLLKASLPVKDGKEDNIGSFSSDVAVNLPQALVHFSSAYRQHFINRLSEETSEDVSDQFFLDAVEGADGAIADFRDEFIFAPPYQPTPSPRKAQELKI